MNDDLDNKTSNINIQMEKSSNSPEKYQANNSKLQLKKEATIEGKIKLDNIHVETTKEIKTKKVYQTTKNVTENHEVPEEAGTNNLNSYNNHIENSQPNNDEKLKNDDVAKTDNAKTLENSNKTNYKSLGKNQVPMANEENSNSSLPRQRFNNQYQNSKNVENNANTNVQNKINDQRRKNEQLSKQNSEEKPKENQDKKQENKLKNNNHEEKSPKKKESKEKTHAQKVKELKIKLILLGAAALFLILLLIILGIFMGSDDEEGYYNYLCDYNESYITIADNSMTLKQYVLGATSYYDNGFNNEALKAIMIILKTNALSYGNYSSFNKNLTLDLTFNYNSNYDDKYQTIYEEISGKLYLDNSYEESITSLGSNDSLDFNQSILTEIKTLSEKGYSYEKILNNLYKNTSKQTSSSSGNNILVGDSRTTGMVNSGIISSDNAISKVGGNYSYLVNEAQGLLENKIAGKSNYNVYFLFGINDLGNVDNYFNQYLQIAKKYPNITFYVVNVGPVDESKCKNITNTQVDNFNNKMSLLISSSGQSNLKYLKITYNISSYDSMGVHYSSSDYINIYNSLIKKNSSSNSKKSYALYELIDYCTYYNYSDSTSFWWPIGSASQTETNIYGGNPTATTITSSFGYRVINGISSNHKGIDISGGSNCFSNIIIASRSGTVVTASDSCPTVGYYQNSCGGGYGNYIIIDHGDGYRTLYAHLTSGSVAVSVGQTVTQGQKIGVMGSSGSSTGCHLHFEVQQDGVKLNPEDYVSASNPRPAAITQTSLSSSSQVTGNSNEQTVCLTLKAQGYSNNAVAAIMVNMRAESNFSPTALGDNGTSYGLCQWHNDRWTSLKNYCGGNSSTIACQLNYLTYELQKSYPGVYSNLRSSSSANSMAYYYCYNFEVPANRATSCQNRADKYASTYSSYVGNNCG